MRFSTIRRATGMRVAAALAAVIGSWAASGQPSETSYWPKLHRDARNSGASSAIGLAADVHVRWAARIGAPVATELHSTPVLSGDNSRIYIGGQGSTLTAVKVSDGAIAWKAVLGDGTGVIHQSATVAADGAIFIGAWDNVAPFDGFSKIRDNGGSGEVEWTYPMRQVLAPAVLLSGGWIVVVGRHENDGWGYFGLMEAGGGVTREWFVATGAVGGAAAASASGSWVFGGTDTDKRMRQIDAMSGAVASSLALQSYVWASSSALTADEQFVFLGEGMTFGNPNPLTEGKLYAMKRNGEGIMQLYGTIPLNAGHLNGGVGALRTFRNGRLRLYVPANGVGTSGATLQAIEFDPDGPSRTPPEPVLSKKWFVSIGGASNAYPSATVTRDGVVYVVGPANHTLYAIRDAGDTGKALWTLPLTAITRVQGWAPAGQRCGREVVATPDGRLYWFAADGFLYAFGGWLSGDMDGDAKLDSGDVALLDGAVQDRLAYEARFPEIDATTIGDLDGNGALESADVVILNALISGG